METGKYGGLNIPRKIKPDLVLSGNCCNLRKLQHLTNDDCKNVEVSHIKINTLRDSPNTDVIHMTGSINIDLNHCAISIGDDCISIIGGSHQIMATDMICGLSHGISIGSLGEEWKNHIVSNVKVRAPLIAGADNGVRIKSWQGGKGIGENIKWKCLEEKEAVKRRNVVYQNIKGFSVSNNGITMKRSESVPCEAEVCTGLSFLPMAKPIPVIIVHQPFKDAAR
ncbi:hypothetical protein M9H77_03898 [Catharanthus roseus]|uniref:Uncharacterized protein n=1 Tax=Catharanthus roseus TaxID=4058 RepID=A0ACC0CCL0_CATRO|nr:hypothetical protein M9H77_03898 [Catharanthus roseus]